MPQDTADPQVYVFQTPDGSPVAPEVMAEIRAIEGLRGYAGPIIGNEEVMKNEIRMRVYSGTAPRPEVLAYLKEKGYNYDVGHHGAIVITMDPGIGWEIMDHVEELRKTDWFMNVEPRVGNPWGC